MNSIEIFEKYAREYDAWFDENRFVYESEVQALKKVLNKIVSRNSRGLEVGVGTGRFASLLEIKVGVEPARSMADIARKRGIEVYEVRAENLPFDDSSFDFVLMVLTICFVQNPVQVLKEARRIIKRGGHIIIGMIDKESFLGRLYEAKKGESKFYSVANFYSLREVLQYLKELD
ncbi:MAG TPA: class I SAM-dependent methyltransferase, partial [Candidatus Atribacteria bacterium]|nr:class I SAM-dependent methyltransferase [Candidatus Atribacteria bacterium]